MTYSGLNFRATADYVIDPAGFTYVLGTDMYGSTGVVRAGLKFGFVGASGYPQNWNSSFDPRLAGSIQLNTFGQRFRIDLPNALYAFRLGVGHQGVPGAQSVYVWDGDFRDYTNNVTLTGVNVINYPASGTQVDAGKYLMRGGNLYLASAGGRTGGTPPTGTGTTKDGQVTWTYIRSALLYVTGVTTNTARVLDVLGHAMSTADWPSAQGTSQPVAVTRGFVTVTRGENAALMRSIAFAQALPANTLPPEISTATIGVPMEVITPGSWDGPFDSVSYDWRVDGVSRGASYTPVESDRTKTVTVVETITRSGASASATSAGKPVRRTEPEVAFNFGKLTPLRNRLDHWGKVPIRNLSVNRGGKIRPILHPDVAAPTSWTVGAAIVGNDAHWHRNSVVTDGFTPVLAAVPNGSYQFPMTAVFADIDPVTGQPVTETQTLTVTIKDGCATMGGIEPANLQPLLDAVTLNDTVSGNAIELAVGFFKSNGLLSLNSCRQNSRILIRQADQLRPAGLKQFRLGGSRNFTVDGIVTSGQSGDQHLVITTNGLNNVPTSDCEIRNYRHDGGPVLTGTSPNTGIHIYVGERITIDGAYLRNVYNGVISQYAVDCVIKNLVVDGFGDNGMLLGQDSANWTGFNAGQPINGLTVQDFLIMRPMRVTGTHSDGVQIADTANGGYIRLKRGIITMAGGNAAMQGMFGGANGAFVWVNNKPDYTQPTSSVQPLDVSVTGLLGDNRGSHGLSNSRGANSRWQYVGIVRHDGSNLPETSFGQVDTPAATGPWIGLGAVHPNLVSGTSLVRCAYASDYVQAGTGWTAEAASVHAWDRDRDDAAPAAMIAAFHNGDPEAYLDATPDAEWLAMSPQAVAAKVKAAHRPAAGGVLATSAAIDPVTGDWRAEVLSA